MKTFLVSYSQLEKLKSLNINELNSIPLYYISLFYAPRKVIHTLDGIREISYGGSDEDKMNINLVTWEVLVKPKERAVLVSGALTQQI